MFVRMRLKAHKGEPYKEFMINTDYIQRVNIESKELVLVLGNTSWRYEAEDIDKVLAVLKKGRKQ